jgi:hypothetical protein
VEIFDLSRPSMDEGSMFARLTQHGEATIVAGWRMAKTKSAKKPAPKPAKRAAPAAKRATKPKAAARPAKKKVVAVKRATSKVKAVKPKPTTFKTKAKAAAKKAKHAVVAAEHGAEAVVTKIGDALSDIGSKIASAVRRDDTK